MDDGKFDDYGAYLCVGNISDEEGNLLINFLKNKFNLESNFQFHDRNKNYHNIYIKATSRSHFFNLIKPYIIPAMMYKLIGGPPSKNIYNRDTIILKHLKLCEKANRRINYSGNNDIKIELQDKIKENDFKKIYIDKVKKNIQDNKQISQTKFRTIPSNENLLNLFSEGKTDQQVADLFGFGRNRISFLRRSLNIPRKRCRNECL